MGDAGWNSLCNCVFAIVFAIVSLSLCNCVFASILWQCALLVCFVSVLYSRALLVCFALIA